VVTTLILVVAFLLSWGTASAAALAEDPSTSVLRGRVLDAQTGEAIAKAAVTLPALNMETSTDAAGHFSFAAMPPGDVEILVTTIAYGLGRKTVRETACSTPTRSGGARTGGAAATRRRAWSSTPTSTSATRSRSIRATV
jgi:hypothetical protein